MYTIDTCPNFKCGDCKFHSVNADRDGYVSQCKRIDHKLLKFATPWFKSYDCGFHHMICSDFEPRSNDSADYLDWDGFEKAFPVWVQAWLPYGKKRDIPFVIKGHSKIRYYVPFDAFVYGPLVIDRVLQATHKSFQVRSKKEYGVQLYTIKTEEINGETIEGGAS